MWKGLSGSWKGKCSRNSGAGEDELPTPPYAVYNVGGGNPVNLLDFVSELQNSLVQAGLLRGDYDFAAHQELVGMQPGDVPITCADSSALSGIRSLPRASRFRKGFRRFAEWYRTYYNEA